MIGHSQNNTAHSYIIKLNYFVLYLCLYFSLVAICGAQSNQGDDDCTIILHGS